MTYKGIGECHAITLTAGNDYADGSGMFLAGGNFSSAGFKFTAANENVTASGTNLANAGAGTGDILVDVSTADNDVINYSADVTVAAGQTPTITNIETIAVTGVATAGAVTVQLGETTGLKTVTVSGTPGGVITLANIAGTGATTVDASNATSVAGGVVADFSASTSIANLTLKGGVGADALIGGLGADTISGGDSADRLVGNAGTDTIDGGAGADVIDGGAGNDTLTGGAGADIIVAGAGDNKVTAGAGDDVILLGNVDLSAAATINAVQTLFGDATDGADETATYANGQITFTDTATGPDATNNTGTQNITAATALAVTAAGSNTLVFADTATNNGNDTVRGFAAGALAAGGDVLDVTAYLGGAAVITTIAGADGSADNVVAANVVIQTNNAAATDTIVWKASSKYVLVQDNGTDTTVSYVTTDGAGAVASTTAVATLVGLSDVSAFVAANFA